MNHSRKCIAQAMISAIENARDSEYVTDENFVSFAKDGTFLWEGYAYLEEPSLCICQ